MRNEIPTDRPTLVDFRGQAWQVEFTEEQRARTRTTGLAQWLISAPWAHPIWHNYLVTLIHLRTVPGILDAKIYLPGATHEFTLFAMNPEEKITISYDGEGIRGGLLTPANFYAQLIADSDLEATKIVEQAVRDIIRGALNPDTDARSVWIARFGGHCIKPHVAKDDEDFYVVKALRAGDIGPSRA